MIRASLVVTLLLIPALALAYGWGGNPSRNAFQTASMNRLRTYGNSLQGRREGGGLPKSGRQYNLRLRAGDKNTQFKMSPSTGASSLGSGRGRNTEGRGVFRKLGSMLKALIRGGKPEVKSLEEAQSSVQTAPNEVKFIVVPRGGLKLKGLRGTLKRGDEAFLGDERVEVVSPGQGRKLMAVDGSKFRSVESVLRDLHKAPDGSLFLVTPRKGIEMKGSIGKLERGNEVNFNGTWFRTVSSFKEGMRHTGGPRRDAGRLSKVTRPGEGYRPTMEKKSLGTDVVRQNIIMGGD